MGETAIITAKTPESTGKLPVSKTQKRVFPQKKSSPASQILHLQRTMGNQAVQRLLKSGTIQAKLKIGKPNDKYEMEADRVADKVMSMPESGIQRQPEEEKEEIQTKPIADQITPLVQRQTEPEEEEKPVQPKLIQRQENEEEEPIQTKLLQRQETEEEEEVQTKLIQRQANPGEEEKFQTKLQRQPEDEKEEPIQRQPLEDEEDKIQKQTKEEEEKEPVQAKQASNQTPAGTSNIESSVNSLKGGGQPLSESTRSYFEPRFGTDFSQVRLHTDSKAAEDAKSINAKAFTKGKDVVFGSGQYSTGTSSGKRLLAHELTHVVQQRAGAQHLSSSKLAISGSPKVVVQRGLWGWIKKKVKKAWGGIKGIAKSTWNAVKRAGSLAVRVAKRLGKAAVNLIKKYGKKVVGFLSKWGKRAIAWITKWGTRIIGWIKKWGTKVIKWLIRWGTIVIKWLLKLGLHIVSALGRYVWRYVRALPKRLWGLIVHHWNGIKGVFNWMWTGLKGLGKAAWRALTGAFHWLKAGLSNALSWLKSGLMRGAKWAIDFIKDPSLEKLKKGLFGALSWLGKGVKGFAAWGWQGLVGAAKWAAEGIVGLAKWLFDGVLGRLEWAGRLIIHLLEIGGLVEKLQLIWELFNRTRPLNDDEKDASKQVHAPGLIPYHLVRVDENSILTRINGMVPFVSFHIIHYPGTSLDPDVAVHELTHVAQYEHVGAVYTIEALYAQNIGVGYNYGNLADAINDGKRFSDFNREQQASICEDYYSARNGLPLDFGGTEDQLRHYVNQMNKGEF